MNYLVIKHQGPLLLTWFNFDPRLDKYNRMPSNVWDGITNPFPNFIADTLEVWEWISNFIPHFKMDVITYPCLDLS